MLERRSLLNFAILIVVAAATTVFVLNSARKAVAQIDALNDTPIYIARRQAITDDKRADTSDWKTYRNEKYGFEVKYPIDWKVADTSRVLDNRKYPAVNIESPARYNIPGYDGIPVSYRILILTEGGNLSKINSVADFGSPELGHQSAWNVQLDGRIKEATAEYKIGQQIISSFHFID